MLAYITEIIGPRTSGRTTRLNAEILNSLVKRPDLVHVTIATDIRIRELIDHVNKEGIEPIILTINPLHRNANYYQDGVVTKLSLEEALEGFQEKDVILYVDNITLPNTMSVMSEVVESFKIPELFYTGISFHFGKGRSYIRDLFQFKSFKDVKVNKIKLKALKRSEENVG